MLQLEERVTVLEEEIARLKCLMPEFTPSVQPWWEQIAGGFADDPAFDEAMRVGREYREAQRPCEAEGHKD